MSPYERRRRGNALRGDARRHSGEGNTRVGQRGSGHLAVAGRLLDSEPGSVGPRSSDEPKGKPQRERVYAGQRLSLARGGKALGGQPRSEPDSGNPTVRDRRGAPGNVAMGAGLRPVAKAVDRPPDPKARAPGLYPDSRRAAWPADLSCRVAPPNRLIFRCLSRRTLVRRERITAPFRCVKGDWRGSTGQYCD